MSALLFGDRPWYRLTLPGTQYYPAFKQPALDPLLCWPDQYQPTSEHSTAWGNSLKWDDVPLMHGSVHAEMGFQPCTVNYAFNNIFLACGVKIIAAAERCFVGNMRLGIRHTLDAQSLFVNTKALIYLLTSLHGMGHFSFTAVEMSILWLWLRMVEGPCRASGGGLSLALAQLLV